MQDCLLEWLSGLKSCLEFLRNSGQVLLESVAELFVCLFVLLLLLLLALSLFFVVVFCFVSCWVLLICLFELVA